VPGEKFRPLYNSFMNCAPHQAGNQTLCFAFYSKWEFAMRTKHVEQTILTTVVFAACVMFFLAAYAAIAHAQNPSTSLTLPEQQETPVSPTTPGTLPGTNTGDTAVGTHPITGQPCIGGGLPARRPCQISRPSPVKA
jgi:hypothetical protein